MSQSIDESRFRLRLLYDFISVVSNLRLFFRYFSRCLEPKIVLLQELFGFIPKQTVIALELSIWWTEAVHVWHLKLTIAPTNSNTMFFSNMH